MNAQYTESLEPRNSVNGQLYGKTRGINNTAGYYPVESTACRDNPKHCPMDQEEDDNDEKLFRNAMRDAVPLTQNRVVPYKRRRRPEPLAGEETSEAVFPAELADRQVDTGDEILFVRPGVQKRVFADLHRGRIPPDATIDLHGLRVHEARPVLAAFMQSAWDRHFRCVRIIHGKGRGSNGRQPVLKQKVDQWLPQWEAVLAYCSAPSWDGGTGATYVLIKRKRPDPPWGLG